MSKYKLVPVEPTPEMLCAFQEQMMCEFGMKTTAGYHWRVYAAMLAAAPEPDAEPVAWMVTTEKQDGTQVTYPITGRYKDVLDCCDFGEPVALYTAPQPAKQPLTDEQILAFVKSAPALETAEAEWIHVVRLVEAAHGIGSLGGSRMVNTATDAIADLEQDNRALRALIERLEAENKALFDSCKAKADRIDRLGEAVERLQAERGELLAACKSLVGWFDSDVKESADRHIKKACAAIAKVEGKV